MGTIAGVANAVRTLEKNFWPEVTNSLRESEGLIHDLITDQLMSGLDENKEPLKPTYLDDPYFELPLDEKGHLDVDEWLSQEFMFQIPTVLLCSPDCAGLCPQCGKKKAECTCQPAEPTEAPVDTRLAILKSLLN